MDEKMNSKNHLRAKIMVLIPIFVFVAATFCMVIALILEGPTNKGTIYSIFGFIGLINLFLSPLPCLVLSVIGIVFAAKALKEGIVQSRKFLVIGILEIFPHIAGVILAVAMFIAGQGV